MSELEWVPQSCTLPTAERPLRVAEWDGLFAERLVEVVRSQPLTLRLELTGGSGVADQVRDLAEREGGCCSFFTFAVTSGGDGIGVEVSVDASHEQVLDALAARAGAQVSR
ncbi:hypothetical protein [Streptomyces murinus]|uniref:hypothetical protein n=1 Tax=Streptomyces murinus TaxID=33900 RepID=UPI0037F3A487